MGLDTNAWQLLLLAKRLGVDYRKSAMIGRQGVRFNRAEMHRDLRQFGYKIEECSQLFDSGKGYSEHLFRWLGALEVHSFDNSKYEGATHIHDMNQPIPAEHKSKYSMVFDGGSLEHVFNFPMAIRNCMEMVEVGGHYLAISPTNNCCGNGFYQISPELYFSLLQIENGYALRKVFVCEARSHKRWFEVMSPKSVQSRVCIINRAPVWVLVVAQRISDAEVLSVFPQQSDYVRLWSPDKNAEESRDLWRKLARVVSRNLPLSIKRALWQALSRFKQDPASLHGPHFKRIRPSDVISESAFHKHPAIIPTTSTG